MVLRWEDDVQGMSHFHSGMPFAGAQPLPGFDVIESKLASSLLPLTFVA
jgi:hypothetical protein